MNERNEIHIVIFKYSFCKVVKYTLLKSILNISNNTWITDEIKKKCNV